MSTQSVRIKVSAPATFKASIPVTFFGVEEPIEMKFEFVYKDSDELEAWRLSTNARDPREYLPEVVKGWGTEFVGDDDKPVPFSKEALVTMLTSHTAAAHDIGTGYFRKLRESRVKN